jgi:hypothetical protein
MSTSLSGDPAPIERDAPTVAPGIPYADAAEHIGDHMQIVLLALRRHIARHRHRLVQAGGRLSDLYVSLGEVRHLLGGAARPAVDPDAMPDEWPTDEAAAADLAAARAAMAARVAATRDVAHAGHHPERAGLPLEEICEDFGLCEADLRLLVAAVAPQLSVDIARLYTFAWADFALKVPPVWFLAELVADGPSEIPALVAALADGSRLAAACLIETRDSAAWGEGSPIFHRAVVVPDSVIAAILGRRPPVSADLAAACVYHPPEDHVPLRSLILPRETLLEAQRALGESLGAARHGRVLLVGAKGSGRRTLLLSSLAGAGRGVLTVDLGILAESRADFARRVARALREAGLRRAVALLRCDALLTATTGQAELGAALRAALQHHPSPVALSSADSHPALHGVAPGMVVVRIPSPDAEGQSHVWERMLGEAGAAATDGLAVRLAERYRLTPGSIARAVSEARAQSVVTGLGPDRGALGFDELGAAVARGIAHELTALAEPITTQQGWDDVILPADLRATLREVVAHATLQPLVFRTWGFARKFEYGRGLACLFSGPPGTGKTMMAGILGRELGRDVYRVDLSRITSKWIGETEKNLSRVFAEADKAQVILLFDEADSLFAKRTQVQTSNDRFANAEVNYLLQRMESYDGITILTTNFDKEMDDAFKRRLRFKIRFPMPDEAHRERLWASMLPPSASVAEGVDFSELARRFELSGGSIKNAVLRAAFLAASEGRPIHDEHFAQAASAEAREMGVLVRG